MKRYVMAWALLFMVAFASTAFGHSTQGRKKVNLKADQPTVDDVAYYVESYVNRYKYADTYPDSNNRFIAEEILGVEAHHEHPGEAVTVHFRVLDKKENRKFEDNLVLDRTDKGLWVNNEDGGKVIYTYVSRFLYNYTHYVIPGLGVTALLALLSYFSTWVRQRRSRTGASEAEAMETSE